MGFLSRKPDDPEKARVERVLDVLMASNEAKNRKLTEYLRDYYANPQKLVIEPFSLYLDVLEAVIFKNKVDFNQKNWFETVKYAEGIYPHIFILEENTPNFKELSDVYIEMFDVGGVVSTQMFIPKLYHLFREKMNYLRWYRTIEGEKLPTDVRESITDYGTKIRPFCTDEDLFTASLTRFSTRYLSGEKPDAIIKQEFDMLCRMAGIYNVSEERIMLAEQKIDAVQAATSRLQDSLMLSEQRSKMLSELSKSTVDDVKSFCDGEVGRAKIKVDNLMAQMNKNHTEFVESQRKAVLADKDELVNSVVADSRRELNELRRLAEDLVRNARDEMVRAGRESDDVINKIEAYFKDNNRIRDLLKDADTSKKLNERIDRLMVLSEKELTTPPPPPAPAPVPVPVAGPAPAKAAPPPAPKAEPAPMPDALAETGDMAAPDGAEDTVDFRPCALLDEKIAFTARYKEAMKRKEIMKKKGVTFHKMFDDVLTAVMENANPYLIGPSGCGKTYMVQQIATILGLESIDIGYINEEYDILGFQTANGGYSRPNFYRCYKYGKIAFCDELDNGNSRATVKLNSFLSNTVKANYTFPNGERVPRHPNFRIIGAGNTTGNGADVNYNTREKIEESVQQRFMPIFVGYDNEVERSILGTYNDWFRFVELFRAATTSWSKVTHFSAAGIITTRDVTRIRKYLDNRSFDDRKIMEYEFVQTKDAEYLAYLAKEIDKGSRQGKLSEGCKTLCELFIDRVKEIVSGEDSIRLI